MSGRSMKYNDFSDASLLHLICSGKHAAFTEIVARHTDRFFALAYRTLQNVGDAEDVVQNAFIKLWQNPGAWNGEKSQFTTWFYRVIINACHDHIRKQNKTVSMEEGVIESLAEPVSSEQVSLEQSQTDDWRKIKAVESLLIRAKRAITASVKEQSKSLTSVMSANISEVIN